MEAGHGDDEVAHVDVGRHAPQGDADYGVDTVRCEKFERVDAARAESRAMTVTCCLPCPYPNMFLTGNRLDWRASFRDMWARMRIRRA